MTTKTTEPMKLYIGPRGRIINEKRVIVFVLGLQITGEHIVSIGGCHLDYKAAWYLAQDIAEHSNGSIIIQAEVDPEEDKHLKQWVNYLVEEL